MVTANGGAPESAPPAEHPHHVEVEPPPRDASGSVPRLRELDSLRGLAALTVVTSHLLSLWPLLDGHPLTGSARVLQLAVLKTPFGVFAAGGSAVRLFFVLSGFVLALPFLVGRGGRYPTFALRRIVRLALPFWAVLVIAAVLREVVGHRSGTGAAKTLVDENWVGALDPVKLLEHVSMVLPFSHGLVDSPMWSLAHEMRISLVFPLLVLLVLRCRWWGSLAIGLALGVVAAVSVPVLGDSRTSFGPTVGYLVLFIAGIVLARHRTEVVAAYRRLPGLVRLACLGVAFLLYVWPNLPIPGAVKGDPWDNWAVGLGACWMVVAVQAEDLLRKSAHLRVPTFLGDISYSMYLVHMPLLLALLFTLHGHLPTAVIAVIVLAVAVLAGTVVRALVERPSIDLGRRLSRRAAARP